MKSLEDYTGHDTFRPSSYRNGHCQGFTQTSVLKKGVLQNVQHDQKPLRHNLENFPKKFEFLTPRKNNDSENESFYFYKREDRTLGNEGKVELTFMYSKTQTLLIHLYL